MAKIKLTKSELKSQRDSLKQFQRFLPTLQLKKQQLQVEIRDSRDKIQENEELENKAKRDLDAWVSLFGQDSDAKRISELISVKNIDYGFTNIAGVQIPIFRKIEFNIEKYNLFLEPLWLDGGIKAVCNILEIRIKRDILREQFNRLSRELEVTSQRVNLFEKVKIPYCRDNIRKIQIYLGDQQTAAVCRSKIAKKKLAEVSI